MTAEQFEKWENWALKMSYIVWDRERSSDKQRPKKELEAGFIGGFCFGAEESREAYKSALRKAIEEEKEFEMNDAFDRGYKAALNFCLEKIDTVTLEP